jgi:diguanylate cyclase (GGDEF)-like protein
MSASEAFEDERDVTEVPDDHGPAVSGAESTPGERHRRTAAIVAYSSLLVGVALLIFTQSSLPRAEPLRVLLPQPAMLAVVCVLWAAAVLAPVSFHYRGNTNFVALDAIAMLIGFVFLAPWLFIIGCVVVTDTLLMAAVYRQRPLKLYFNMATVGLVNILAVVVYRAVLGTHSPVSVQGLGSATLALMTVAVIGEFNVRVVTRLNGQISERRTASHLMMHAMLTAAATCLAFVVLNMAWFDPTATVPLLLVAALLVALYRGYTRLTLRYASLQRLYEFNNALSTASQEPSSLGLEVLRHVCTVMRTRRAELVLAEPLGIPRRLALTDRGPSPLEPITLDGASIVTTAIASRTPTLYSSSSTAKPEHDPVLGDYHDAVVSPLMSESMPIGAIVALDRDEEFDRFDGDDLRLFGTLTAHAGAALERARLIEELRHEVDSKAHQATHDMLTGLPNRTLFVTEANAALHECTGVAIALLDLDHFKDVNDTLGHTIGDRLLCDLSERLGRAATARTTLARLGGDEFAIVVRDVEGANEAFGVVLELLSVLSRPVEIDGLTLHVQASAGIALSPDHGDDVALLIQRADIAMYLAKARRSAVELYSEEHDQSMRRKLLLGELLTHALETGTQLSVEYQPIAEVATRKVVGVEALARWEHPEHGSIPPEEFIAIAEQMGLVSRISDVVLAQACAQAAAWRRTGLDIGVAVNMSGAELTDGDLVQRVSRHLRTHDLPADLLTIEVTETQVVSDLVHETSILDELTAHGVRVSIDDYGTGSCSLAYLHRLPVHKLKIDRSFITNLANEDSNRIIVESSIAMAHSLGLRVVAEGAEDALTCALLADAGCDLIQGYHLARPMTANELTRWLGGAEATLRI